MDAEGGGGGGGLGDIHMVVVSITEGEYYIYMYNVLPA